MDDIGGGVRDIDGFESAAGDLSRASADAPGLHDLAGFGVNRSERTACADGRNRLRVVVIAERGRTVGWKLGRRGDLHTLRRESNDGAVAGGKAYGGSCGLFT